MSFLMGIETIFVASLAFSAVALTLWIIKISLSYGDPVGLVITAPVNSR
jgi:hypothetical protein